MAKVKETKTYREKYIITFNDEDNKQVWVIGNLLNFLRHLYIDNALIRKNTSHKSAQKYAIQMASNIGQRLYEAEKKERSSANFYLVPTSAGEFVRQHCSGTITRKYANCFKGLQAR